MFVKATRKALLAVLLPLLLLIVVLFGTRPALRAYFRATYPLEYWETIQTEAAKHDIDPTLILAVIRTESHFNPKAVSSAGAKGLMQITPIALEWAQYRSADLKSLTEEDLFDPATNIRVGVYILALLRETYPHTETALAAYNAGYGNVGEWLADSQYSADGFTLQEIPYPETAGYVKKVNEAQIVYRELYEL